MDEVYRRNLNASASGTSSTQPSKSNMAAPTAYTPETLKQIGEKCSTRLPPASLVQAMFMYELQRHSELESLFHDHIFQLAQIKKAANEQGKANTDWETRLTALEKKFLARDVDERIATSHVRMNAQQEKLNAASGRLESAEKRLDTFQQQLEAVEKSQQRQQEVTPTTTTTSSYSSSPDPTAFTTAQQEINVLFHDRDGILQILSTLQTRLATLEENIQKLTIPSTTPPAVQHIPLQTATDDLVDLSIPMESSAVSHKENRPMRIRSFQPGKQWDV